MTPSYRIVFYISGHGFGHASRSLEVVRALLQRRPDVAVTVKTSAPRRLLDIATSSLPIEIMEFQCDSGMAQIDSLRLDVAESVRRATAFHADLPQKAETEARFLHARHADLVVGDIPPLAFAAATAAGLPSVALGNFTWDWIYAGYPDTADLVRVIRAAYAGATMALRLPMAGGFDGLERKTRDVPFIARRSLRPPDEVRGIIGVPRDKPLVLTSFGGHGLAGLNPAPLARLHDYSIVTDEFPGKGLQYQDLVRAADVVVTKPGYGIISECIANDTAMLYTSRGDFPEYDVLVREMPRYLRVEFIEQEDLLAGRWKPSLERVLASPNPPETPAVNGAALAAGWILEGLGLRA